MHRYFLELNYDGTPFKGWQVQDTGPSVQEEINKALILGLCLTNQYRYFLLTTHPDSYRELRDSSVK